MGCTLTTEEVAHIDRTIAKLNDENARLRSCLTDADENARLILGENAKLRELVRDMADAIVDWYDLIDGAFACESVYVDEKFAPLFDRMRELGVEP